MEFIKKLFARKIVRWGSAAVILVGLYFGYTAYTAPTAAPQYVTAAATTGTLVVSVSETGQAASSAQVNVLPQVSGQVVKIYAKQGQTVKVGAPLFEIDATSAEQAV